MKQNSLKKIVIIGPESTGKTTLSKDLAENLKTVWVPEFARTYVEKLKRQYVAADLMAIAKGQLEAEKQTIEEAENYLICDTDLYVIKVWSENSFGYCDREILEQIAKNKYDYYFLTYTDVAWESDPLREHPASVLRNYFFKIYLDIVQNTGVPFTILKGNPEQRLKIALTILRNL